jgi:hypothetical protein
VINRAVRPQAEEKIIQQMIRRHSRKQQREQQGPELEQGE